MKQTKYGIGMGIQGAMNDICFCEKCDTNVFRDLAQGFETSFQNHALLNFHELLK